MTRELRLMCWECLHVGAILMGSIVALVGAIYGDQTMHLFNSAWILLNAVLLAINAVRLACPPG